MTYHWKQRYVPHHSRQLPVRWFIFHDHVAVVVKKIRWLGLLELFPSGRRMEHIKDLRLCKHSNERSAKSDSLRLADVPCTSSLA